MSLPLFCNHKLLISILLLACMMAFSCRDNLPTPYFDQGTLYGRANLDSLQNFLDDYSGITVELAGPYGKKAVQTATDGSYGFSGLGNGTYELTLSRKNYGTMRYFGIQVFGTDSVNLNTTLFLNLDIASVELTEVEPSSYDPSIYDVSATFTFKDCCFPYLPGLVFFMSDSKDVSSTNYKYSSQPSYQSISIPGDSKASADFLLYVFPTLQNPFYSGEKLYAKAYAYDFDARGYNYWDPYREIIVYPTMTGDGSNVISFSVP